MIRLASSTPSFSLVNSHKSTKNYTIDDTTGEIFLDASSNPAVVTALNTSNLVATTDFFTFGDTLPELGSGDFTLNIFFKFTSFAEDFPLLFSKWLNPSGRSIQVYYYVANETMSFAYSTTGSNTNTITVPYTATLDTWAMFTGVRSGGDFLMYINGVQIGTTQSISGTIFDTATDWRLSGYAGATEVAVLGSLVYPKVYNKALIAAEVVELYNDGDPKCYDDLSVDLKDSLLYAPPLSNDGTNIGDELIDPAASVTTVNNGAVAFDEDGISEECTPEPITEITALNTASLNGTSQYFQTTNLVDTTAAWSIVMRVKFNAVSTGEAQTLYSDYAQSTNLSGVVLRQWYNTSKFVVSVDNNTLHISHTVDLVADKWYMLGASYDSVTGYKIVINDTIETNASQLATDVTTLTHIGAIDHPIVQAFGGSISHYFVYDKALSNANFIELYNDIDGTGTPKCYADLSTDLKTSLVAAWSLSNTGTPGGETIDLSGNGNDLTAVGSPTYTGSGLSEDCAGGGGGDTPDDGTIHEVGYRVKDSINTFQGVVKFIYKDTAFTGGTS